MIRDEALRMTASEQARADALADAETLAVAMNHLGAPGSEVPWALGLEARFHMRFSCGEHAPLWAIRAARAAFRAVPGLRGTDADEKALHGALCLRSKWLNAPCGCGVGI